MKQAVICALSAALVLGFAIGLMPAASADSAAVPLQLAQAEEAGKKAKKKKEKRECRRVRETGSRIASRVCRKPSEWARLERQSRESVERSIEGSNRNTSTTNSQ